MNREEIIKKLRKLKELADKGVGGEKTNADKLYKRLLQQFDITEEELLDEQRDCHPLVIKEDYLQRLILQITACHTKGTCHVVKDDIPAKERRMIDKAYGKGTNVVINCTKLEFIQVMFLFDIYKASLKKSLSAFLLAFFQTNDLLPESPETASELSEEEKERALEAMGYSINMTKTSIAKRIE